MKLVKGASEVQSATFAAGCFWGVEESFRVRKGVKETAVGYMGGHTANPSYAQVCTGTSGHAEAVQVKFDPSFISYDELLTIFWQCHNPMSLNRQGPDVGTQYRSAIFFHTPDQEKSARRAKEQLEKSGYYPQPLVTEIVPATHFYPAEEYHQQYLKKRGINSCH